jgi:short-subunit dehydrogenase
VSKNALVIGATGGIGSACCQLLEQRSQYTVHSWNSNDLDLNHPDKIFETELSSYDLVINCAAHNQGTYLGFLKNSWQNQLSQIMVNYVSNLFLLKHYANSRSSGQYVWCSTDMTSGITPYKSVYLSTKLGSQFAIDLARQEAKHISILEAQFKSVRTNLRYRNFQGTLTKEQVEETYNGVEPLTSDYVAAKIIQAIDNNLEKVLIE